MITNKVGFCLAGIKINRIVRTELSSAGTRALRSLSAHVRGLDAQCAFFNASTWALNK